MSPETTSLPAWIGPRSRSRPKVLVHSGWDAVLITLALVQGMLLLWVPSIALVALGLWWNANTISHNFIHRPFFRSRAANRVFSAYLSLVLGLPQTLWRERHLAHHAGRRWKLRWTRQWIAELVLVAGLWVALVVLAPAFVLKVYLPGFLLGLVLCQIQGHYEHVRGVVSHYGGIYNLLFFNDGYHVEHHARPAEHWMQLPQRCPGHAHSQTSRWPAIFRWLELFSLDSLERLVLRSPRLQGFVLHSHEAALRKVMPPLPAMPRIGIVGGGLFPRTALALQRILPEARLLLLDANAKHLERAREFVRGNVEFTEKFFEPSTDAELAEAFDLLIIPLAFSGDRSAIYRKPPARLVLVHDWLWRPRGFSAVISILLLKRLNFIQR